MRGVISTETAAPKEIPADLRSWLPTGRVLARALDSAISSRDIISWASDKIKLAILMDAAAAD